MPASVEMVVITLIISIILFPASLLPEPNEILIFGCKCQMIADLNEKRSHINS